MSVQAYVGTFLTPASGTGVQPPVTGIVDSTGAAFTPKALVIWGAHTGQFSSGSAADIWDTIGFDDGTAHVGQCIDSQWFAGSLWRGVGDSLSYSILSTHPRFSAGWDVQGYVGAFGSGSFTYTLDLNNNGALTFGFLALGGSSLSVKVSQFGFGIPNTAVSGTAYTITGVPFQPTGAIFVWNIPANGTYNDGNGEALELGWCDTALNQSAMSAAAVWSTTTNQVMAGGALHTGAAITNTNTVTATSTDFFTVTGWTANGFTGTGNTGTVKWAGLLIGGQTTLAGTFDQLAATGSQSVTLAGITPAAILFGSVGATGAAGSTMAPNEAWTVGAFDGTRSWNYWHGVLSGVTSVTNAGAQWGSANTLQFAQNNGTTSATVINQGTLAGTLLVPGLFQGTWSNCDGTARRVMFFAFGGGSGGTGGTTTTYQIRRLRRVAIPWDEAHRFKTISRLELIAQAGIGDSVTTDPKVMLRVSRDGGLTWGTEHHLHAGAVGQYLQRLTITRLGRARNPVIELTTTDPVAWQWVELLVDLSEGTS